MSSSHAAATAGVGDKPYDLQDAPQVRRRLSRAETLELCRIRSPKTLRKYVLRGIFPQPIRITAGRNGRLEWYLDDVLAYLDGKRDWGPDRSHLGTWEEQPDLPGVAPAAADATPAPPGANEEVAAVGALPHSE